MSPTPWRRRLIAGVTVTRRGRHTVVLNRGDRPAHVDLRGTDLLIGAPFPGAVDAGSAVVVEG